MSTPPDDTPERPSFLSRIEGYYADVIKLLGSISAVIVAWKAIPPLLGSEPGSDAPWICGAVGAIPLLLYVFCDALPRWREARHRDQYIDWDGTDTHYFKTSPQPPPAADKPITFARPDSAEKEVHAWITAAASPLLHLTGASGTGKSSLLNAFVVPTLQRSDPAWHVITLRSFDDPLAALAAALPGVWKNPPADLTSQPLAEQLTRAVSYLQKEKRRLLLIFDQFEELFILHPVPGETAAAGSPAPLIHRVRELLTTLTRTAPLPGLTVLLSYRSDHREDIDTLHLTPRNEDYTPAARTAFDVQPFTLAAARAFLTGCPGFTVPGARLQQALDEATAMDENTQRARPIVLNLLGRALQHLAAHPRRALRRGRLLHDYIRTHAFDPREADLPRHILPCLLSEKGTIAPATAAAVAQRATREGHPGLTAAKVTNYLSRLRGPGIVRQIGTGTGPDVRWEIAHDFIARLIHLLLGGPLTTAWRKSRPFLVPAAAVLVAVLGIIIVPAVRERNAINLLGKAGFHWQAAKKLAAADGFSLKDRRNFDDVAAALKVLHCRSLYLTEASSLESLSALSGLDSLALLQISYGRMDGLEGLEGVTSLKVLRLKNCGQLTSLESLRGHPALSSIEIENCGKLVSTNGLSGLPQLQLLELNNCGIISAKGLSLLPELHTLKLKKNRSLTELPAPGGMPKLDSFDLSGCATLTSIDALGELPALRMLDLRDCSSLAQIAVLRQMKHLEWVDLSFCRKISKSEIQELRQALPSCQVFTE